MVLLYFVVLMSGGFSTEPGEPGKPGDVMDVKVYDHHLHVFVPPKKNRITKKYYVCGKEFVTTPIEHLFQVDLDTFGLTIIHGESAKICKFSRAHYDIVKSFQEDMATRHRKGGQSQNRHQRNNDIQIDVFNSFIAEDMTSIYLGDDGLPDIKALFIVGTGDKRNSVFKKLPKSLQNIVLCQTTIPSQTTTIEDILLLHRKDWIESYEFKRDDDIIDNFLHLLNTDDTKAIYGPKEVQKSLKTGLLQYLIIHKTAFMKNKNKIKKQAEKVGCTIQVINSHRLDNWGNVVGISWY